MSVPNDTDGSGPRKHQRCNAKDAVIEERRVNMFEQWESEELEAWRAVAEPPPTTAPVGITGSGCATASPPSLADSAPLSARQDWSGMPSP